MERLKTLIFAAVIFLSMAAAIRGQPIPPYSSSNSPSVDAGGDGKSMVLQPIEFDRAPLSFAIGHVAQRAHVNVIIDGRLQEWWDMEGRGIFGTYLHPEPVLTFRWKDTTPKQALKRLLLEHDLVLVEDPQTSIAQVTFTNHVVAPMDASLFGTNETSIPGHDPTLIPLIEFQEVPLTVAIENLARQAGINYMLDPQIGYGRPDKNGWIKPEPVISCYWENVTSRQALMALLKNYGLTVGKDPTRNVIEIKLDQ